MKIIKGGESLERMENDINRRNSLKKIESTKNTCDGNDSNILVNERNQNSNLRSSVG